MHAHPSCCPAFAQLCLPVHTYGTWTVDSASQPVSTHRSSHQGACKDQQPCPLGISFGSMPRYLRRKQRNSSWQTSPRQLLSRHVHVGVLSYLTAQAGRQAGRLRCGACDRQVGPLPTIRLMLLRATYTNSTGLEVSRHALSPK